MDHVDRIVRKKIIEKLNERGGGVSGGYGTIAGAEKNAYIQYLRANKGKSKAERPPYGKQKPVKKTRKPAKAKPRCKKEPNNYMKYMKAYKGVPKSQRPPYQSCLDYSTKKCRPVVSSMEEPMMAEPMMAEPLEPVEETMKELPQIKAITSQLELSQKIKDAQSAEAMPELEDDEPMGLAEMGMGLRGRGLSGGCMMCPYCAGLLRMR